MTYLLIKSIFGLHYKINESLLLDVFFEFNHANAPRFKVKLKAGKVFLFEYCPHNACSFDKLLMVFLQISLSFKLYPAVNRSKKHQNGESKMLDQYAYNLEEILVYLKVVDFFDELGYFMLVVGKLFAAVKF